MATAASGFLSLACLRNATSGRGHALGCMVVSSLKIMHFSLFQTAPGEPSVIEQAPGDGRLSQRPLLRADMFALNTNRCGFKTRSNGQGEHAGLALLDGDGPASQARRLGRPASASVQTRKCTKRRAAQSNHAHNTPGPAREQGLRRDPRSPGATEDLPSIFAPRKKNGLPAPREKEEGNEERDSERDSF
jgi:hypothetical protein